VGEMAMILIVTDVGKIGNGLTNKQL